MVIDLTTLRCPVYRIALDFGIGGASISSILDIAGVEHFEQFNGREVKPMQGKSVLGLLNGKMTAPYAEADQVGYELFGQKAFFDGDWKILLSPFFILGMIKTTL